MTGELFWRFALISSLAFGGGAGLPLVERVAVREAGWIDERDFAAAVAFGQLTPGPVLVLSAFIGYRAAGPPGAVAATLGAFAVPWFLAAASARPLRAAVRRPWLRGFVRGAGAASVGLLGVTALGLARHTWAGWSHVAITTAAVVLAARTKVHPALILLGGAAIGAAFIGPPPRHRDDGRQHSCEGRPMPRFDAIADSYDHFRALPEGVPAAVREAVLRAVGAAAVRLLEVGAGTGRLGAVFAAAGDDYVGADPSRPMLARFAAKLAARAGTPPRLSRPTAWHCRSATPRSARCCSYRS